MIVACGDPLGWKDGDLEEMLRISAQHGFNDPAEQEKIRKTVSGFLGGPAGKAAGIEPTFDLWANRQTMIAFTTMMWAAETMGYDTAPMEGFMEDQVKALLKIPERVRVVALLAIGRLKGKDKHVCRKIRAGAIGVCRDLGQEHRVLIEKTLPQIDADERGLEGATQKWNFLLNAKSNLPTRKTPSQRVTANSMPNSSAMAP